MLQILNILAAYRNVSDMKGTVGVHRLVEAFKHTYALRMHLADPAFADVNSVLKDMLSPAFAAELQKSIDDNRTREPRFYGGR